MFWEIRVPRDFKAVVTGRVEERLRFYVRWHEPIYFVNFAPVFIEVSTQARCREGIIHNLVAKMRVAFQADGALQILEDQGYSDRSQVVRVQVQDLLKRHGVVDAVKASISTYIRETDFERLANAGDVGKDLEQRAQAACAKARLAGEVVSCEVTHVMPDADLLAEMTAAGFESTAEYFRQRLRQKELIDAQPELAKAEAERFRVEAQKQIEVARNDVKIVAMDQQDRIKAHQAELDAEDAKRQEAAQERNSRIKECGARYEFEYKMRRVEEERRLTIERIEIGKLKDAEEATARERRRLDMHLDLEREEGHAKIRAGEKTALLDRFETLLAKVAAIPVPDYSQLHTLVTSATPATDNLRELTGGLLWALLTKAVDLATPEEGRRQKAVGA